MPVEPWQLQPARDTGLTPAERFRSVRRESGLLESVAQQACFSVLRIYFAIAHRLTISGREKLPAHGPFVLAANHCSHLDALVLGAALKPRHRERAFPIAAGDVFFQTTAVSVFSAIMLNALPMWRKNCGPHALAELRRKLQEEKAIFIIFPEGGRTRTGSMMPFKHGLGMLVAETNVPVVPCGLIGSFEALPPNRKVPQTCENQIDYRRSASVCIDANDRAGWSQIARSVESRVRELGRDAAIVCTPSPSGIACVTTVPRIAPAFAPDQEERARRSAHRCPHIAVRGRDQPDGSPRSTRFRSRESETASAIAMS